MISLLYMNYSNIQTPFLPNSKSDGRTNTWIKEPRCFTRTFWYDCTSASPLEELHRGRLLQSPRQVREQPWLQPWHDEAQQTRPWQLQRVSFAFPFLNLFSWFIMNVEVPCVLLPTNTESGVSISRSSWWTDELMFYILKKLKAKVFNKNLLKPLIDT